MIDLNRTLSLVKGGIFDPDKTWRDYLPEAENWQKTAFLLRSSLKAFRYRVYPRRVRQA